MTSPLLFDQLAAVRVRDMRAFAAESRLLRRSRPGRVRARSARPAGRLRALPDRLATSSSTASCCA
jgi:hypothetical protein